MGNVWTQKCQNPLHFTWRLRSLLYVWYQLPTFSIESDVKKKMKTQLPIEHVFENMEREGLEYPFFCEANPLLFVFLVDLYNCEMQVAEVFKVFFFQTADWHWIYLPAAVTCLCLLKFLYEMDKILRYDTILTIAFAHLLRLLEHCGLQRCNSILFPEGSMVMTINPLSITKGIL